MNILLQSTVEPMVLTAGRLREAALFAYRRFLLESVAPGGTVDPAVLAHGGTLGPWVLAPGLDLSAFRASHGPQMEALDELRWCEGVRRAIAAMPECEAFLGPLDADAAGVTGYFATISTPCDMRTVGQRLASAAAHLLCQITGAETVDAATEASEEAALALEAYVAAGASAVTADVKPLPMKPWRLVTSRWATYDAEQCRDDLLLVSVAQRTPACTFLCGLRALPLTLVSADFPQCPALQFIGFAPVHLRGDVSRSDHRPLSGASEQAAWCRAFAITHYSLFAGRHHRSNDGCRRPCAFWSSLIDGSDDEIYAGCPPSTHSSCGPL